MQTLYHLKSQVHGLSSQLAEVKDDIRKLFQAQEELEQAL